MIPLDDPMSLSLLFHLNSEPWLNDEAYRDAAPTHEVKQPPAVLYEWPMPAARHTAVGELIARRRSVREFSPSHLSLDLVSTLLANTYGLVDFERDVAQEPLLRRSVPSAGGIYPLEIYVLCRRIEGVPDGIHHYDVLGHGLRQMTEGDPFPGLEPMFYTYPFMHDANLILAIGAVFRRTQKKYGPRGYRYILIEAGHLGQNLCLTAAELGLATLCMGGFIDSQVNGLLKLDDRHEGIVYTVAVGSAV